MSNFEYIKEIYNLPAEIGRIIEFNGEKGIIICDNGHYLGVNFDKNKPGVVSNVHPTDNVKYLGIGKIRKMTPGQKRYQDYLSNADCFDNFLHFLKYSASIKNY